LARPSTRETRPTVVDASVLINFLGLGRFELLTGLARKLIVTAEVNRQIKRNRAAFDAALESGRVRVENPPLGEDAELFARLSRTLGIADASCIAGARALGADLAADDRTFRREAPSSAHTSEGLAPVPPLETAKT
jgi:predicted nucleic acid-binding protein